MSLLEQIRLLSFEERYHLRTALFAKNPVLVKRETYPQLHEWDVPVCQDCRSELRRESKSHGMVCWIGSPPASYRYVCDPCNNKDNMERLQQKKERDQEQQRADQEANEDHEFKLFDLS